MDGFGYLSLSLLWMVGSILVVTAQGVIICECTTQECLDEGTDTCYADHFCYSQYFKDTLTHGCMNDRSSLLCENHKPKGKGIEYWPSLYCCNDRNFCNKDVTPTLPADEEGKQQPKQKKQPVPQPQPVAPSERERGDRQHDSQYDPHDLPPVRCPDNNNNDGDNNSSERNSSGNKVINPIYIAVPVAGVCVLLALVIFAMYLLRRRQHYDNYHHYHDHLALPPPGHAHKQPGGGGSGVGGGAGGGGGVGSGGGGGVPLYHHHHHCDCICKKALPPCGGKVNRCTDSERSSSGSETKLFLQA
ncbi:uncharacterized protein [Littorina saxatilis]|uniref:Uncharacterized protein n=1 Tax=Littorina saxatilis TaxID=31220 RepID=A0AAN9GHL8_9CAEN